jgi:hypothetical protein
MSRRDCAYCGEPFEYDESDGRSRKKQVCSEDCRKRLCDHRHRANCVDCGVSLGIRSGWNNAKRCRDCEGTRRLDAVDERAKQIVAWWREGRKGREIADEFGWPVNRFSVEMVRLRELGYDLPYRYTKGKRAGRKFA